MIPEILGYMDPARFPVYPVSWWEDKERPSLAVPEEVWAVTTIGGPARGASRFLRRYWDGLAPGTPRLRVFAPGGVEDVSTPEAHERMAEAVFRLALAAREAGGAPLYSLAGGRKTMSSLLQAAAGVFGAAEVFHVASEEAVDVRTRDGEALKAELSEDLAAGVHPVALGAAEAFEGLEWSFGGMAPIRGENYPLSLSGTDGGIEVLTLEGPSLYEEVARRRREATRIAQNYFIALLRQDTRENFRTLYRLPSSAIQRLRDERIGADPSREAADKAWLRRLPKTDLHCHLGGVALPGELPEIAQAVWREAGDSAGKAAECAAGLERWLAETPPLGAARGEGLRRVCEVRDGAGLPVHLATSAVIRAAARCGPWLDALCLPASGRFVGVGIRDYMEAGWLQGSALLQSPAAIGAACRLLVRKAARDAVSYLEVRCSPAKYAREGLTPDAALEAIRLGFQAAAREVAGAPKVELLIIGTRHSEHGELHEHVRLAAEASGSDTGSPRVRGFDLAGDESTRSPAEVRHLFMPLFEKCLKITVHAGETEPVERVWEAVYHLNADRVGHGLQLALHPDLLAHFRDRGTAVELCPSSNDQVVGFWDVRRGGDQGAAYPVRRYLEEGVRACVCTDNPGISRTDWTGELYKAAAMVRGGLSRWEILILVRNGFEAAFLPLPEGGELLRSADEAVYRALGAQER
ncbi:MAG: hypothetical protein HZB55_22220 [Deltaproteobacteria bacterium]|nr:hypothetical protein [Deltaproteobacteria bacterium]